MKKILVAADSTAVLELLDAAREDDLLVQSADGSEFLVTVVDDFDEEVVRSRRNKKLMEFLDQRAAETQSIPLDEVKRRLGLSL